MEVLWVDRWVSAARARSVFLEVGHWDVIRRQFPDTMLTISATMLTIRAMVFVVSEIAYCALGTGPFTVVQQVALYFALYFPLILFGLRDATPFWFRLWFRLFQNPFLVLRSICLLYTSDAADE